MNNDTSETIKGISIHEFTDYESVIDTILQCVYDKADCISPEIEKARTDAFEAHSRWGKLMEEAGFKVR